MRKKAEAYQPACERELNSEVMRGIAVAIMVRSRDTRKTERMRAVRVEIRRSPRGYSVSSAF